MSFCEHCAGQRFDRAQVLRILRVMRRRVQADGCTNEADEVLAVAIKTVRSLEIPHLESFEELMEGEVIH